MPNVAGFCDWCGKCYDQIALEILALYLLAIAYKTEKMLDKRIWVTSPEKAENNPTRNPSSKRRHNGGHPPCPSWCWRPCPPNGSKDVEAAWHSGMPYSSPRENPDGCQPGESHEISPPKTAKGMIFFVL